MSSSCSLTASGVVEYAARRVYAGADADANADANADAGPRPSKGRQIVNLIAIKTENRRSIDSGDSDRRRNDAHGPSFKLSRKF